MCVPFPVKPIKANNVIDNIIQNIYNINDMMKLFTMMTMNNGNTVTTKLVVMSRVIQSNCAKAPK